MRSEQFPGLIQIERRQARAVSPNCEGHSMPKQCSLQNCFHSDIERTFRLQPHALIRNISASKWCGRGDKCLCPSQIPQERQRVAQKCVGQLCGAFFPDAADEACLRHFSHWWFRKYANRHLCHLSSPAPSKKFHEQVLHPWLEA